MLAWKPLQDSSAFRVYCKGIGKDISEYDDVAKNLDDYRDDPKWKSIIEESKKFIGVVESVSESPCFTENTLVRTNTGYKKIKEISPGDNVLTHIGKFKPVVATNKKTTDNYYNLKVMGSEEIEVTGNHPFYIRKHIGRKYTRDNGKVTSVRKFSEPYWEKVENLEKGDYIAHPINQNSILPDGNDLFTNPDFWWTIGRYFGDGWTRITPKGKNHGQSYHVLICCSKINGDADIIEKHFRNVFNYTKTEEKTTYRYDISSKFLYYFLEQFGKYAYGKHLTDTIFDLPITELQQFLDGYFSADGYKLKDRTRMSATTASKELIYGLQQCIHKVYKKPTTIVKIDKEKIRNSVLEDGRKIVAKHDSYIISFSTSKKCTTGFYEDGYMWLPFRSKEIVNKSVDVYNLQVDEDESYTVNNIAVHNCSMLLYDKPVRKELGLVRTSKGVACCLLDGYNCDKYKYLKND